MLPKIALFFEFLEYCGRDRHLALKSKEILLMWKWNFLAYLSNFHVLNSNVQDKRKLVLFFNILQKITQVYAGPLLGGGGLWWWPSFWGRLQKRPGTLRKWNGQCNPQKYTSNKFFVPPGFQKPYEGSDSLSLCNLLYNNRKKLLTRFIGGKNKSDDLISKKDSLDLNLM